MDDCLTCVTKTYCTNQTAGSIFVYNEADMELQFKDFMSVIDRDCLRKHNTSLVR
jgi:hypothetical protein